MKAYTWDIMMSIFLSFFLAYSITTNLIQKNNINALNITITTKNQQLAEKDLEILDLKEEVKSMNVVIGGYDKIFAEIYLTK